MKTYIIVLSIALAFASATQAEAAPRHALNAEAKTKRTEVQRQDRVFSAGPNSDSVKAPTFRWIGRSPGFVRDQPDMYPYISANGS
jgi:hypothetical protein